MVQFINIPQLQASPLLDLSPISNALENNRRRALMEQKLHQQQLQHTQETAESKRRFDAQMDLKNRDFAETQRMNNSNIGLRKAQEQYYRARSGALNPSNAPPANTPPKRVGVLDENGELRFVEDPGATSAPPVVKESRVLAGGASNPGTVSQEHAYYGKQGQVPSDVPGIVVTPKGGITDVPATQAYQGQRAARNLADKNKIDLERAQEFKDIQRFWTEYTGQKPKAGHVWNSKGQQVPAGSFSKSGQEQEQRNRAIEIAQKNILEAEKNLLSHSNAMRTLTKETDDWTAVRMLRPESMDKIAQSFSKYKEGTLNMVYALSGKQTTNKEMENFLEMYAPRAGDSNYMIMEKTARLNKMLSTLKSSIKDDMLYDDEKMNAAINKSIAAGMGASPGQPFVGNNPMQGLRRTQPQTPANPVDRQRQRLYNQYGLE